jgi:hypothetical protein
MVGLFGIVLDIIQHFDLEVEIRLMTGTQRVQLTTHKIKQASQIDMVFVEFFQ